MNREIVLAMCLFCTMGYLKMRYTLIYDLYNQAVEHLHKRDEEIGRLKKELDETRIESQGHLESYESEQNRMVDGLMEAVASWKK